MSQVVPRLPGNVRKLAQGEMFRFHCHPDVSCFTDCCRQLELALTPYDVLRLRKRLHLSSADFLDQYASIEQGDGDAFPLVFLAMVDDGRASCPFVSTKGCTVYEDRPGACRAYPLGRGAFQTPNGKQHELHVLLTEPHCRGFQGEKNQDIADWGSDQGLTAYNSMNDAMLPILHHRRTTAGMRLTPEQAKQYLLALYDPDAFRDFIMNAENMPQTLSEAERENLRTDDGALYHFAVNWLLRELYGE